MNEPTESEVKRFWEWCGFTYLPYKGDPILGKIHDACWLNPSEKEMKPGNWHFNLPDIDLNNLFKYAVPKLPSLDCIRLGLNPDGWACEIISIIDMYSMNGQGKTPTLALFRAIYKVIDKTNTPKRIDND